MIKLPLLRIGHDNSKYAKDCKVTLNRGKAILVPSLRESDGVETKLHDVIGIVRNCERIDDIFMVSVDISKQDILKVVETLRSCNLYVGLDFSGDAEVDDAGVVKSIKVTHCALNCA